MRLSQGRIRNPASLSSLARIKGIPIEKWNALTRLGICSIVACLLTFEKSIYTPPIHSESIPSGPAQFSLPLQGKQVVLAEPVWILLILQNLAGNCQGCPYIQAILVCPLSHMDNFKLLQATCSVAWLLLLCMVFTRMEVLHVLFHSWHCG